MTGKNQNKPNINQKCNEKVKKLNSFVLNSNFLLKLCFTIC
jgi:hypothetical protein